MIDTLASEWHGSLKSGETPVSVNIIICNEAPRLPRLLRSLIPLRPAQVIVGDTGSTDGGQEIARHFGCQVVEIAWQDHFAQARNQVLDLAHEPWCLWIDGDEELEETGARRLHSKLVGGDFNSVNYHLLRWTEAPRMHHAMRLWRNREEVRWRGRVFEKIWVEEGAATRVHSDIAVISYDDERRPLKDERNLRLVNMALAEEPNSPYFLFHAAVTHTKMQMHAEAVRLAERYLLTAPQHDIQPRVFMHYLLAWTWTFVEKDYQKAVNAVATALQVMPCAAELWCLLGDIYWHLRRFSDCLTLYENAIELGRHSREPLWLVDLTKYDLYPRQQIEKLVAKGVKKTPFMTKRHGLEMPFGG